MQEASGDEDAAEVPCAWLPGQRQQLLQNATTQVAKVQDFLMKHFATALETSVASLIPMAGGMMEGKAWDETVSDSTSWASLVKIAKQTLFEVDSDALQESADAVTKAVESPVLEQ